MRGFTEILFGKFWISNVKVIFSAAEKNQIH
jgi:hypothetical protein